MINKSGSTGTDLTCRQKATVCDQNQKVSGGLSGTAACAAEKLGLHFRKGIRTTPAAIVGQ